MTSAHVYIRKQANNIIDEKNSLYNTYKPPCLKNVRLSKFPRCLMLKISCYRTDVKSHRGQESLKVRRREIVVKAYLAGGLRRRCYVTAVCLSVCPCGAWCDARALSRRAAALSLRQPGGCAYGLCDHSYPFFDLSGRGFVPQRREE